MDQTSAQTEKIATYETSRTRRSIVDGNIHSDDSNNDEEYATSGFYVREKTTEKKPESVSSAKQESDKECKENGMSAQPSSPPSPVANGEKSKDEETNKESKEDDSSNNTDILEKQCEKEEESENKEDKESENDNAKDSVKELNNKKEESEDENKNAERKQDGWEKTDENASNSSKHVEDTEEGDKKEVETTENKGEDEKTEEKQSEGQDDESKVEDEQKEDKQSKEQKDENKVVDEKMEEKQSKQQNDENKVEDEKKEEEQSEEQNEIKKEKVENIDDKKNDQNESKDDEKQKTTDSPTETTEDNPNKNNDDKDDNKSDKKEIKRNEKTEGSILKEHLEKEKKANGNADENETEMEMDEDFDPSLLCPDISMDVDEAPVITNNESIPEDGNTSPLPYEATFSTLVDEITGAEVQVDLTPEEMELRQKMYGPNNLVQTTKIHCTACNIHLGSALTGANNRFVHPLLKVLICKNCYHFYTSGEFEKDEDGSELYCRWCGQGGQVLCCSSCEFVFCKRCIRNNFGPKKFKEIRDSDDWNCFRCDRGQLSNLRASCAEFMEYYRTELARAQSLSQTNPELMTTDYTTCCKSGPEKKEEPKTPTVQKNTRRKRKDEEDPDYQPIVEEIEEPPKKKFVTPGPTGGPGYTVIPPALRPVLPKPPAGQVVRPVIMQQGQKQQNQGQVFKVGNTTFRARAPSNGPGYTVQRPTGPQGQKNSPGFITIPPSAAPKSNSPGYITIPPSAAPKTTSPGYIKILPQRMQTPRPTNSYTVVSGTSNGKPTFTTVRPKQPATMPAMKHEWFEKTVRAAARVNSNLSYTLTQLNRQQSQANSVEALAMVHNKLQEVLSTSINSLIQIRKNLRTEFISGIKNIKFPPKPAPIPPTSGPIVVKDDDDVIFINPPQATSPLPPPPPLALSPTVTLTKKTPIQKSSDPFADPKPSTSGVSGKSNNTNKQSTSSSAPPIKGGFLKVRSFTALQSVPSECITIPDDPPLLTIRPAEEEDPLKITEDDKPRDEPEISHFSVPDDTSTFNEFMVYNVKEEPTPAIKKMLNAFVVVKKSRVVDEIIRAQGLLTTSENNSGEDGVKENNSDKVEENDDKGSGDSPKEIKQEEVKEDTAKREENS